MSTEWCCLLLGEWERVIAAFWPQVVNRLQCKSQAVNCFLNFKEVLMKLSRWVFLQLYRLQNQLFFIWVTSPNWVTSPWNFALLEDFLVSVVEGVCFLIASSPTHDCWLLYMQGFLGYKCELIAEPFHWFTDLYSQCKGQMKSFLSPYKPPLTSNPTVSFSTASFCSLFC